MNTNVSYVLGAQESKNLAFYLAKYTSKLPNEVTEFAPLIMKTREAGRRDALMPAMQKLVESARTFPSSAPDKEASKRISQFFLTKVLNKASGLEEFSSHQHAALLLGYPSSFASEEFQNCDVQDLMRRASEARLQSVSEARLQSGRQAAAPASGEEDADSDNGSDDDAGSDNGSGDDAGGDNGSDDDAGSDGADDGSSGAGNIAPTIA